MGKGWDQAHVSRMRRICYRTIWAESDWWNLANPTVPDSLLIIPNDGFGTDKDSTGLYQQRSRWWGSVAGSMDPYVATTRFVQRTLANTPDWFGRDEPDVCQRTQRSQYDGVTINLATGRPYPYAANYAARQAQTDALAADPEYFTHLGKD